MSRAIIQPKRPNPANGWKLMPTPLQWVTMGYDAEAWLHESGLYVISAVEVASDQGDIDKGPEYHVSISMTTRHGPARCDSNAAAFVIKAFGMDGAEEDNHVPNGKVRNFWRPVAENLIGHECHCKGEEPAIREDKGDFIWRGITD